MELAPDVGPAGHRDHRPRLPLGNVERVEPGIGIGDEVAGKSGEVALRMLALAVGAVDVGRRRRRAATVRALVAHIDPQPPGFGLALPDASPATAVSSACSSRAAITSS